MNGTFEAADGSGASYIVPFETAGQEPVGIIGGKCAGLAALANANAPVSPGFAVTTDAFSAMMAIDGLGKEIGTILARLDVNDIRNEAQVSRDIDAAIARRPMPAQIEHAVRTAYQKLCFVGSREPAVAVRSSGTGEDLPMPASPVKAIRFFRLSGPALYSK